MQTAALVALVSLLGAPGAAQRPGDLDPSWGRAGVARTLVTQDAARLQLNDFSVLRTQSGKIVVFARSTIARPKSWFEATGPVVLRYTRNGELDPTFGRGGIVRGPAAYESTQPFWDAGLALPDGRLLVRVNDFDLDRAHHGLLRLLPDGRVDRSFGVRGRAIVETGCRRHVLDVVRQPDGKLVELVDACGDAPGPTFFGLVRLHANGRLDRSFGKSGLASLLVGAARPLPGEAPVLLLQQPDGKLVVAGHVQDGIALARFRRDGRVDRSFGRSGVVLSSLEAAPALAGVVAQPGGRLLVVGCAWAGGGRRDVVFLRYTRRGALDTSFAEGGVRLHDDVLDLGPCGPARAARGRIVLFAGDLLRFRADGTRDAGFARNGALEDRTGDEAMLVQTDGKIVVAGRIKRVGKRFAFVRRHLG